MVVVIGVEIPGIHFQDQAYWTIIEQESDTDYKISNNVVELKQSFELKDLYEQRKNKTELSRNAKYTTNAQ